MSVDINWDTFTTGSDGAALAETIRAFMHNKFQQITLPRFINSVHVHSFDFGDVCPEIEIKDIGDPLPDFYEDDGDDEEEDERDGDEGATDSGTATNRVDQDHLRQLQEQILQNARSSRSEHLPSISRESESDNARHPAVYGFGDHFGGLFPRSGTPGIPGGTSNLSYFHLPIGGMSGTQTPLAAVASGTHIPPAAWNNHLSSQAAHRSGMPTDAAENTRNHYTSYSPTRPSTASSLASPPDLGPSFSPGSPEQDPNSYRPAMKVSDDLNAMPTSPARLNQVQPSDMQVVARVKYAGNVKMMLTAEILLDYPMPSFVGIPLKLSITGMTFDGVAILAYIRKRMHFCFLSPEDADALVGDQLAEDGRKPFDGSGHVSVTTGLLQEIHVESEIGRKENGKQVLKNVGKVEKFVLEQVRRIFEEEFVFPSFWTFLV